MDKMKAAYANGVRDFYIMHGNILVAAQQLSAAILEEMPEAKTEIGEISSVVAVHAGEGTLAVLWVDA